MKTNKIKSVGFLATSLFSSVAIASNNGATSPIDVLTGDTRTACEVILCLSSAQGKGIAECKAPLRKYFSIRAKKWHKTLQKRRNFLDLCPAANENAKMSALTTAIQNQEYACDASTLNSRTETKTNRIYDEDGRSSTEIWYRTQSYIPKFCQELYKHEFTEYSSLQLPKYVCNKDEWFREEDWTEGYTNKVVSRKWNRETENYDYEYQKAKIQKNCWEQPTITTSNGSDNNAHNNLKLAYEVSNSSLADGVLPDSRNTYTSLNLQQDNVSDNNTQNNLKLAPEVNNPGLAGGELPDLRNTYTSLNLQPGNGFIISPEGICASWSGANILNIKSKYTIIFYTDIGNNESIKNIAEIKTNKNGGFGLCLGDAIYKSGAPIILIDDKGNTVYKKNGNPGKVFNEYHINLSDINGKEKHPEDSSYWYFNKNQ